MTVDLLAEIRAQLAVIGPGTARSKASELVKALLDAGCSGDVKACQEVLNRIHGRVQTDRPEVLDIGALVAEVAMRAEKRRLEVALLEKRVALAHKELVGPADQIDLAAVSRAMAAEDAKIDREQAAAENRPPQCGFKELPSSPPAPPPWPDSPTSAPITPEPSPEPPVLPGEFYSPDGGETFIEIRR